MYENENQTSIAENEVDGHLSQEQLSRGCVGAEGLQAHWKLFLAGQ